MPDETGRPRISPGQSGKQYLLLNLIFAGVILLIMGYSLFYSPDEERYPVPCVHEKLTGEPCPSCGLSHAFSLIMRGRIDEALEWNSHSIRIFLFFAIQLLMRAGLAAAALKPVRHIRQVTVADAAVSSVMAVTAFWPFLRLTFLTNF
jgi:hypothetical protein